MTTLVGLLDSPYVRRVAISLRLYGMAYDHVALSVFRHREQMQLINPTLKVPLLILDDGTRLADSSLILQELELLAAPELRLLPADSAQRRRVLEAVGLALILCEKTVQLYYEYTWREAHLRSPDWIARCGEQLRTAASLLHEQAAIELPAGPRLQQAQITAAVGWRFLAHIQGDLMRAGTLQSGPLLEQDHYPRLQALSAYCEKLPAFMQTPLV